VFERITNVRITGVIRGDSTEKAAIAHRPSHTFIYKESGESIYHLRGQHIRLAQGTVLYVPQGESYTFEKVSQGESIYYLVNFHWDTPAPDEPHLFSFPNTDSIQYIFHKMQKRSLLFNQSDDRYELLSLFYQLLAQLLQSLRRDDGEDMRLKPALEHLERNLYSHDLSVADLAQLCGLSGVSFRSMFQKKFGESPKRYIIRCRMMRANAILESGEYRSIGQIAAMVGYEDPLYFSRHFKSFFGHAPSMTK